VVEQYFDAAGVIILVYDYFLTFPGETHLIWPTPWNASKVLFLLPRYFPFVDLALNFHDIRLRGVSAETCLAVYKARTWLLWFGLSLPEVILSLRTWAAWDRNRRLAIGLPIFFALIWLPTIPIVFIFLRGLEFAVLGGLPNFSGCVTVPHRNNVRICWILLLTYDAGLCLLMLIRAIEWFKDGYGSKIALTVFRNGLLYYVVILAISLANVFLNVGWQQALVLSQRFLHSIIACRIILDIRGQARKDDFSMASSFVVYNNRRTPDDHDCTSDDG